MGKADFMSNELGDLFYSQRMKMVEILGQDPDTRANEGFNKATAKALLENLHL